MADETPWRDEAVLQELYVEADLSCSEIAEKLGCSISTVSKWLQKYDYQVTSPQERGGPWREKDVLQDMYLEQKISTREIADRLETDSGTISRWLNKHDIESRRRTNCPWQDKERLEKLYLDKELTTTEIAERMDTTQRTISTWLDRYNIETRRKRIPDEGVDIDEDRIPDETPWRDKDILEWLHGDEGIGVQKISEILGCSPGTISNWVDRFDIERGQPTYERESVDMDKDRIPDERPWRDKETMEWLYFETDVPSSEIHEHLGCARSTVIRWLNKHGIVEQKNKKPPKEKLKQLYIGENLSGPEVAERYSVDNTTVYRWLRDHDLKVRKPEAAVYHHPELRDEGLLKELYIDDELSMVDIAEKLSCSPGAVNVWLQRHGIETRSRSEALLGENNPNWEGGQFPYGEGWNERKKEQARERDNFRCQSCGRTQEECLNEWGCRLDVHHIIPAREFDNPEERNELENLVSLCRDCHMKWEGIPLRPDFVTTEE